MRCLYRSDYGAPDPGFDPFSAGGALVSGWESHRDELALAQNAGQLAAMNRQLARGEQIQWCDQGYGWAYDNRIDGFFAVIVGAVILPWFVWRVILPLRLRLRKRFISSFSVRAS